MRSSPDLDTDFAIKIACLFAFCLRFHRNRQIVRANRLESFQPHLACEPRLYARGIRDGHWDWDIAGHRLWTVSALARHRPRLNDSTISPRTTRLGKLFPLEVNFIASLNTVTIRLLILFTSVSRHLRIALPRGIALVASAGFKNLNL